MLSFYTVDSIFLGLDPSSDEPDLSKCPSCAEVLLRLSLVRAFPGPEFLVASSIYPYFFGIGLCLALESFGIFSKPRPSQSYSAVPTVLLCPPLNVRKGLFSRGRDNKWMSSGEVHVLTLAPNQCWPSHLPLLPCLLCQESLCLP